MSAGTSQTAGQRGGGRFARVHRLGRRALPDDRDDEGAGHRVLRAKNFNVWYFFGSLALLVLILQIVTGIFLTMNYKPSADDAFASVEYIMRDVEWGWLIRYMHSTGASAFFIVVYLHMFRALMYGSYKTPRELLWIIGMLIYLALMARGVLRAICCPGARCPTGARR